jgi:hypothetical protein
MVATAQGTRTNSMELFAMASIISSLPNFDNLSVSIDLGVLLVLLCCPRFGMFSCIYSFVSVLRWEHDERLPDCTFAIALICEFCCVQIHGTSFSNVHVIVACGFRCKTNCGFVCKRWQLT